MNRDLHPELGAKVRTASLEAATAAVRERFPAAVCEGSMGSERSYWVDGELVGHAWPVRGDSEGMWLRVVDAQRPPLRPAVR